LPCRAAGRWPPNVSGGRSDPHELIVHLTILLTVALGALMPGEVSRRQDGGRTSTSAPPLASVLRAARLPGCSTRTSHAAGRNAYSNVRSLHFPALSSRGRRWGFPVAVNVVLRHRADPAAGHGPCATCRLGSSRARWPVRQAWQVVLPLALGYGGGDATDSSGDTVNVGVPQPGSGVGAGGGQGVPVRAENHRGDAVGVGSATSTGRPVTPASTHAPSPRLN
jgi:hypothetical protein